MHGSVLDTFNIYVYSLSRETDKKIQCKRQTRDEMQKNNIQTTDHFSIAIQDLYTRRFPYSFVQKFYRTKVSDDLRHRVDSAHKLVMIRDELLTV